MRALISAPARVQSILHPPTSIHLVPRHKGVEIRAAAGDGCHVLYLRCQSPCTTANNIIFLIEVDRRVRIANVLQQVFEKSAILLLETSAKKNIFICRLWVQLQYNPVLRALQSMYTYVQYVRARTRQQTNCCCSSQHPPRRFSNAMAVHDPEPTQPITR